MQHITRVMCIRDTIQQDTCMSAAICCMSQNAYMCQKQYTICQMMHMFIRGNMQHYPHVSEAICNMSDDAHVYQRQCAT